mgnify:FL=1|tara:strand:+ start:483 stop:1148 length:666 start_codon:yes stop_codon:yes gene_type:complete
MNYIFKIIVIILINLGLFASNTKAGSFSITRIQYSGGGDWYSDPSSIPNLLKFISKNTNIKVNQNETRAKIGSDEFYNSYFLYLTGHGNIKFSDKEAQLLRNFLLNGGFLHADDNYGMDKSFRREMKKVFPDKEWVELPSTHSIFNIYYRFNNGLPKIHEHDNKRPQAFALFHEEEIVAIYTYESDLGDGWEDQNVHGNKEQKRLEALKMGANIIFYSLSR